MKLILAKTQNSVPGPKLMRLAGFIYIVDKKFGKDSYSRPLGRYHYPRFHSYIDDSQEQLVINLHLDQKQASYEGFKRHSGEYDGQAVEEEMNRLKSLACASGYQVAAYQPRRPVVEKKFQPMVKPTQSGIGSGNYNAIVTHYQPKQSWWRKIFGA